MTAMNTLSMTKVTSKVNEKKNRYDPGVPQPWATGSSHDGEPLQLSVAATSYIIPFHASPVEHRTWQGNTAAACEKRTRGRGEPDVTHQRQHRASKRAEVGVLVQVVAELDVGKELNTHHGVDEVQQEQQ